MPFDPATAAEQMDTEKKDAILLQDDYIDGYSSRQEDEYEDEYDEYGWYDDEDTDYFAMGE